MFEIGWILDSIYYFAQVNTYSTSNLLKLISEADENEHLQHSSPLTSPVTNKK
jgi:hypothetical protein